MTVETTTNEEYSKLLKISIRRNYNSRTTTESDNLNND